MMVSNEAFSAAGGFDRATAFPFCYFDLCLKMVEQGRRNVYTPSASLYHLGHHDCSGDIDAARSFALKWRHLTVPDRFYGTNLAMDPPTFEFNPGSPAGEALDEYGKMQKFSDRQASSNEVPAASWHDSP